eukprot:scaffold32139_cov69-Skeletonema_marinoi.AAC.1
MSERSILLSGFDSRLKYRVVREEYRDSTLDRDLLLVEAWEPGVDSARFLLASVSFDLLN